MEQPLVFEFHSGDLFSNTGDALVHCAGADLRLGKGIGVDFKHAFGGMEELKAQKKKVGEVAELYREGRCIFYMLTKAESWGFSTLNTLRSCVRCLARRCTELGIDTIALPLIGAGLDGLDWLRVESCLREILKESTVKVVRVYSLGVRPKPKPIDTRRRKDDDPPAKRKKRDHHAARPAVCPGRSGGNGHM